MEWQRVKYIFRSLKPMDGITKSKGGNEREYNHKICLKYIFRSLKAMDGMRKEE